MHDCAASTTHRNELNQTVMDTCNTISVAVDNRRVSPVVLRLCAQGVILTREFRFLVLGRSSIKKRSQNSRLNDDIRTSDWRTHEYGVLVCYHNGKSSRLNHNRHLALILRSSVLFLCHLSKPLRMYSTSLNILC